MTVEKKDDKHLIRKDCQILEKVTVQRNNSILE